MRYIICLFGISILISCTKQEILPTPTKVDVVVETKTTTNEDYTSKSYLFEFTKKEYPNVDYFPTKYGGLSGGIDQSVSGTVRYVANGIEHIIITPNADKPVPPIHLINKDGNWVFESSYIDGSMDGPRGYSFLDNNGSIVWCNTGTEVNQSKPDIGNLYKVQTNPDNTLKWNKFSQYNAFYHWIASGDLNNDGFSDVVASHMGRDTTGWPGGDEGILPYLNQSGTSFKLSYDFVESNQSLSKIREGYNTGGALLITNVMGDSRPEIIKATNNHGIMVFKYNPISNRYEFNKISKELGVFSDKNQGSTSMKEIDVNKDGFMDIAVATEGWVPPPNEGNGMLQIWVNDGEGNFRPTKTIYCEYSKFEGFREFEVGDINKDGLPDIFLHPYRVNPNGVNLKNYILLNDGKDNTTFNRIDKDIILPEVPHVIKGFFINGQLKITGITGMHDWGKDNQFKLIDVVIK